MKQRTILREASIKGKSLHTGEEVHLTLKPAPENHGIVFRRIDLYGKPELKPLVDSVEDLVRSTTIADGHTKVHTVEHVLSALNGCGVDNVLIEMDASEPPILDGSAKHFVNLIQEAEPVEQEAEREYYVLDEPISVTRGSSSIIALPYDGFRITCTSADDRGIHTQHLMLDIDPETYVAQIAPARTFTIYEDIEELLKLGKIKGGSLDSAIVIKGDKIVSKEPLRFKDEFVRHKILDLLGQPGFTDAPEMQLTTGDHPLRQRRGTQPGNRGFRPHRPHFAGHSGKGEDREPLTRRPDHSGGGAGGIGKHSRAFGQQGQIAQAGGGHLAASSQLRLNVGPDLWALLQWHRKGSGQSLSGEVIRSRTEPACGDQHPGTLRRLPRKSDQTLAVVAEHRLPEMGHAE